MALSVSPATAAYNQEFIYNIRARTNPEGYLLTVAQRVYRSSSVGKLCFGALQELFEHLQVSYIALP